MIRCLIFLPVCLLLHDQREGAGVNDPAPVGEAQKIERRQYEPTSDDLVRDQVVAALASTTCQSFPNNMSWFGTLKLSENKDRYIDKILKDDPVKFVRMCLTRYDREVHGYRCRLQKQVRIKGRLKTPEDIVANFREDPYSVLMKWKKGAGICSQALYVKGQNDNKVVAYVSRFLPVFKRGLDSPDSKNSGRYLISEFGMKMGTERTLEGMIDSLARDSSGVKYEGIYRVKDRPCYKLINKNPDDIAGVHDLTIFIDVETWLQTGSILKDSNGELLAYYYFTDIVLNPKFKPGQFTTKAFYWR